MANIARLLAAGGALAGGYLQGKKMQEDAEWEREKRQREREAMQVEADTRQAAASTIGRVGTQTGAAASGEEALAAGNEALTAALAQAKSPEEAATIKANFEPTMAALVAQQGVPAQAGSTYTEEQATKDYIAKLRGIDPGKARQEQIGQLQVGETQDKADQRAKLKSVDSKFSEWFGKNVQKGEDGQPMLSNDTLIAGSKMRTILLSQHGLYDQALQTAKDGMQYATQKIQAETEQRKAAVRDAVAAYGMGDMSKALAVYKQFVPDGADPVSLAPGKDGTLVLSRKSALDGAPLPAKVFKDQAEFLASLNALSDGNALAAYVERTFQHDIESRKVKADEKRADASVTSASASAKTANLAEKKDDRETKKIEVVSKGLADYADAEAKGDTKGMASARRTILANGGKLEKPEVQKPDVKVGTLGDITVSQPTGQGGVKVTNYGPDMKEKGAVNVVPPGAAKVAPPSQADIEATAKKYGITVDEVKKKLGIQ